MDITPIITAVIGLLGAVVTAVIIPWIKSKTDVNQQTIIKTVARCAVFAAQQLFSTAEADKKKEYALSYIQEALCSRGIELSLNECSVAIEAELKEIKTALTGDWGRKE